MRTYCLLFSLVLAAEPLCAEPTDDGHQTRVGIATRRDAATVALPISMEVRP